MACLLTDDGSNISDARHRAERMTSLHAQRPRQPYGRHFGRGMPARQPTNNGILSISLPVLKRCLNQRRDAHRTRSKETHAELHPLPDQPSGHVCECLGVLLLDGVRRVHAVLRLSADHPAQARLRLHHHPRGWAARRRPHVQALGRPAGQGDRGLPQGSHAARVDPLWRAGLRRDHLWYFPAW